MNKIRIIFIALFIIICICPIALRSISKQDTNFEQRTASKLPSIKTEDGGFNTEIGAELETYLSEHFAFRAELVTINSLLHTAVFGVSPEEKAVAGDDGWLYLSETTDDYTGSNILSERGMNNIMRTLTMMKSYCNANGAEFVLAIPPNKATLYNEAMPYWYIKSDSSNLKILTEKLKASDINYVDLYAALSDSDETLYHKRDSHWNNHGALVGSTAILGALGITPSIDWNTLGYETRNDWRGDLDDMIYPTLGHLDRQYYYPTADKFSYSGKNKTPSAYDVLTESANGKDMNVLFFRDSFFNTALQFIAPEIANANFVRYIPYSFNDISKESYDAVVLEIVERNIVNLAMTAPIIPAEPTTVSGSLATAGGGKSTLNVTADDSGFTKISGVIERDLLTADTEIYLLAEKDGKTVVYPAFCINEKSSPNGSNFDCGYTLLVDSVFDESWTLSPLLKDGASLTKINTARR